MTLGPAKNPRGGARPDSRRDHGLFMAFSIVAMFVGWEWGGGRRGVP